MALAHTGLVQKVMEKVMPELWAMRLDKVTPPVPKSRTQRRPIVTDVRAKGRETGTTSIPDNQNRRCWGDRIAPTMRTTAWCQTRLENTGANWANTGTMVIKVSDNMASLQN